MHKNISIFFFIAVFFLSFSVSADTKQVVARCEKPFPKQLQTTLPASCNQKTDFNKPKNLDKKAWREYLTKRVVHLNNSGASLIKFGDGKTKFVFRSGVLSENPQCLKDLVKQNKVSTIINLYSDDLVDVFEMNKKESAFFKQANGRKFFHVLDFTDLPSKYKNKQEFYKVISKTIQTIKKQEDNVLIHCLGGMHKTGVLFGVMQKCINKVPIDTVLNNYKCHVDWESEKKPGGLYPRNIKTIKDFPCELI